ncbi:unnamed protein product [Closterium sp. NIES-65]|nr:unnamed protein product [Closterium sp. NIES-65]CAI6011497.1 unnamed protein product [Closterium sp. NIES-65]
MARVSKVASLLCVGIVLLAYALTPANAVQANSADLSGEGTCYRDFQGRFRDSPYFGMVAQGGSVKVRAIGQAGENFNLDTPAWNKLVGGQGGQVEVTYDPVDCSSSGGMAVRLVPDASKYNFALQIFGAARRGRVEKVEISKDGKEWKSMTNNGWGATWVLNPATGVVDAGRAVSVRVSGSGKQVVLGGVIPSQWSAGQIYKSSKNF